MKGCPIFNKQSGGMNTQVQVSIDKIANCIIHV